jgi:hypothetical protein
VQDRSQDKQTDDSHSFILPPNVPESHLIVDRKKFSIFPPNELRKVTFDKINEHGFFAKFGTTARTPFSLSPLFISALA